MKKLSGLIYCCFISALSFAQPAKTGIAIIPEPVQIIEHEGRFHLPQSIVIEAGTEPGIRNVASFLKEQLSIPTGIQISISKTAPTAAIKLLLYENADTTLGKEGYRLTVNPKNIIIRAN
ncbi:MAG: glycoside hydrolase family 20 zincin-like fold domain-containing protein, partial [Daejeonella sp.]